MATRKPATRTNRRSAPSKRDSGSEPTVEEIRATVERLKRDPKVIEAARVGREQIERGEFVRLEDLKRKYGGR